MIAVLIVTPYAVRIVTPLPYHICINCIYTATALIGGVVYGMQPYVSIYCQVKHCSIINYYLFLCTVS